MLITITKHVFDMALPAIILEQGLCILNYNKKEIFGQTASIFQKQPMHTMFCIIILTDFVRSLHTYAYTYTYIELKGYVL